MPPSPQPVVFLDPGHGGVDTGTIGVADDGSLVEEKTVALAIALRTAEHLRRAGITVVLSRADDRLPGSTPADYVEDGSMLMPDGVLADLQRRIDRANASGAQVLLSIHLNSVICPSNMPGALDESLFLSNPAEASAARQAGVQELIATAYARAIELFLYEEAGRDPTPAARPAPANRSRYN